jgi:hypothetical protein
MQRRARGPLRSVEKEQLWRRHVRKQAASRQTVQSYCRGASISEASFYAWRRELAKRDAASVNHRTFASRRKPKQSTDTPSLPRSRFLPVTIGSPPLRQIELVLPGRATIRVPVQDLAALRVLLEWLGKTPVVEPESVEC